MSKLIDITGQKFGYLTVIRRGDNYISPKGTKTTKWVCICDYGKETIVSSYALRNGQVKSCGCHKHDEFIINNPQFKHGYSNTRLYKIWRGMIKRCYQKYDKSYPRYGGRGISICDEWKSDFLNFREWAINNGYDDTLSIDREDTNGNYEPSNCRWATNLTQSNNRRSNCFITYNGESHTIAEWSRITGMSERLIQGRKALGWSEEEIFETPKLKAKRIYGESSVRL